jgi:hypothetical protein
MPRNISLDQPLLEQQSVREMLNLRPEEVNPKVSSEDLLKIARTVIQDELIRCECDEKELLGLRIEYKTSKNSDSQTQEEFSTSWNALSSSLNSEMRIMESEVQNVEDAQELAVQPLPISSEFLGHLATRVNDVLVDTLPRIELTNLFWNFVSSPCSDCSCRKSDNYYYCCDEGKTSSKCGTRIQKPILE